MTEAVQRTNAGSEQAKPQFRSLKDVNPYQPRINAIRKVIHNEDKRLRAKYTWLQHQNTIGMGFFLGSLLGMTATATLYINSVIAWYYMIPLMAFFVSLLHELEHDLIHDLYFKENRIVQHIMFGVIWLSKLNANPWWRKPLHLKHHKTSGSIVDIEERLIGLGLPIGLKKFLVTLTPIGAYLVIFGVANDSAVRKSLPGLSVINTSIVNLPVLIPAAGAFAITCFPSLFNVTATWYTICFYFTMLLFVPNVLRQVSLQLISTGVHYFGDIPDKNVFFQNQVLTHWAFIPFQLFCFNFGQTHIIHHYVTRQPFYLRQMIASAPVMESLKSHGVRFNDINIWSRAHRWNGYEGDSIKAPVALAG